MDGTFLSAHRSREMRGSSFPSMKSWRETALMSGHKLLSLTHVHSAKAEVYRVWDPSICCSLGTLWFHPWWVDKWVLQGFPQTLMPGGSMTHVLNLSFWSSEGQTVVTRSKTWASADLWWQKPQHSTCHPQITLRRHLSFGMSVWVVGDRL